MHYFVSEKFYAIVMALIQIAEEDGSTLEYDLARRLLDDLVIDSPETRAYYGSQ
jgi:hypothetical protein